MGLKSVNGHEYYFYVGKDCSPQNVEADPNLQQIKEMVLGLGAELHLTSSMADQKRNSKVEKNNLNRVFVFCTHK